MPVISVGNKETALRVTPRISTVKEIVGYTHYRLIKGQLSGNLTFDGHKPSAEEQRIANQGRMLADKIQHILRDCSPSDIAELLECYDMAYRLGFKRMPETDFIDRQKLRIFTAWKTGNAKIEESIIFSLAAAEVRYHREKAGIGYLNAYRTLKEKWLDTLLKYNRFSDVTAYENYQRLALFMHEDFNSLIKNGKAAKRNWYEHNSVENFATLSTQILRSYRRFASALFP